MEVVDSLLGQGLQRELIIGLACSLGAAFIIWSGLKLWGLSNKSIKWLWITYKEGTKNMIELSAGNDDIMNGLKNLKDNCGFVLLFTVIVFTNVNELESPYRQFVYTLIFLQCFLYIKLFGTINKAYLKRVNDAKKGIPK